MSRLVAGDWSPIGALLGLTTAIGILIVVARLPWRRTPTLEQRLAPYLRDVAPPERRAAWAAASPLGVLERLLAPVMPAVSGGLSASAAVPARRGDGSTSSGRR